jgi:hypothetical protein
MLRVHCVEEVKPRLVALGQHVQQTPQVVPRPQILPAVRVNRCIGGAPAERVAPSSVRIELFGQPEINQVQLAAHRRAGTK